MAKNTFKILFILMHLLGYDLFLDELVKVSSNSYPKVEYLNDLIGIVFHL